MTTQAEKKTLRDEHPNAWIPLEEGDRLEGTVVEVTRAWSDARHKDVNSTEDGFYPLVRVQTADDVVLAFHAFSVVSFNQVIEHQPLPGEKIIVTFQGLGKKKDASRNAPKLFHISMPDRDPRAAAQSIYARFGGGTNRIEPTNGSEVTPEVDDSDLPY